MPPEQPVGIPAHVLERLRELRDELQPRVPEELGFAIGLKQTGGAYTDELALVVYVPEKKPREALPEDQVVPQRYGDVATDVVELRPQLISDNVPADPLQGGIPIGTPEVPDGTGLATSHNGTLGGLTRDRLNGTPIGMTCGHVVGGTGQHGVTIFQPRAGVVGSAMGAVRASVFEVTSPVGIRDWASIDLNGTRGVDFSERDIGPVTGVAVPQLFEAAKKRGARTGLTTGVVVRVVPELEGLTIFSFEVDTFPFGGVFADHGDSGSWVLNARDEVLGLLFARNDVTATSSGLVLTIGRPLADLGLEVAVRPTVTSVSPNTFFGAASTFGRVTIEGFGFDSGSQVSFGGTPVLFSTFVGPTRIETTPPLGPIGTVDVQVRNRFGDVSVAGPASQFTY